MPDPDPPQASAAAPELKAGETPPPAPPEKAEQTKEEKARALLKGEPPKDQPPDESTNAAIIDPDEDDYEVAPPDIGDTPSEEETTKETPEAKAEREAAEAAAAAEKEEKDAPKRVRIQREDYSPRDYAILLLAKDEKITFAEAERKLYGDTVPKPSEVKDVKKAPTAAELEAKIEEAKAKKVKARQAMDLDVVDALNDEILDLRDQVRETKADAAAREQAQQSDATNRYLATEKETYAGMVEIFPDANKEGTKLFIRINELAEEKRAKDPAFFHRPDWPEALIFKAAAKEGIAPKVKGAEPPKPKAPLPPPKKVSHPINPAPGTATGAKTDQNAAFAERLRIAKQNRDPEAIRAVMRELTAAGAK